MSGILSKPAPSRAIAQWRDADFRANKDELSVLAQLIYRCGGSVGIVLSKIKRTNFPFNLQGKNHEGT